MTDPYSSVGPFLDALSAKTSTPGGGSAAALVGAIAAALSVMAGQFTLGKKKFAPIEPQMLLLTQQAQTLVIELQAQMEKDALGFQKVMHAYADKSEKGPIQLQSALKEAILAPFLIMQKSVEAIQLAEQMVDLCNPNLRTDAAATATFALAAVRVASWNVKVNLFEITDELFKQTYLKDVAYLLDQATHLEEKIRTQLEKIWLETPKH